MPSLDQLLNFTNLLQKFRAVERILLVNNSDRNENDVEHSFSLAMFAWYINATYKLGLDIEKVMKYALVHDLVEVHAGDTFFYNRDAQAAAEKQAREEKAADQLAVEYPEFSELHEIIKSYEKKADRESKFIYALDKIEPLLNIYLDGGRTWRRDHVTLDMITTTKKQKVAADATIAAIFEEIIERLRAEEEELFGNL